MKKMMITLAAVAIAAGAQAVNCTWGTDILVNPETKTTVADESMSAFIYKISAKDYADIQALGAVDGQKALYAGFNAEDKTLTIGENVYSAFGSEATSWDGAVGFDPMKNYTTGDHSTIAAIMLLDSKATSGFSAADYYLANVADQEMGSKSLSPTFLGSNWGSDTGAEMTWQSVPEPTSGLLLLLGVAGLALRRRRA